MRTFTPILSALPPTSRLLTFVIMVLAVSFSATSAAALDVTEGTRGDRYSLEREGDRFVRLDRQTGEITNCIFSQAEIVCRLAVDERNALANELDRLSSRIQELEEKLASGGDSTDENKPTGKTAPPNIPKTDEQLDSEFERVLDYTTKAMRRFFIMMKELRNNLESESQ